MFNLATIAALSALSSTPVIEGTNVLIKDCNLPKQLQGLPLSVCGEQIILDRYGRAFVVCDCQWLIEGPQ